MAMDKKQKGLIALTVVALGFLGYQVFQLVSGDMSQNVDSAVPSLAYNGGSGITSQPTQHTAWQPQQETPLQRKLKTPTFSMKNAVSAAPKTNKPKAVPAAATVTEQPAAGLAGVMQRNQQAYLKMINEYELAKMQRQLLDEKTAIATAQNKIIALNQKNRALGAKVPTTTTAGLMSDTSEQPFRLSYLDKQEDQWSATLSRGDEYQQVTLGSLLPGDYKVTDISHQGVVLQKDSTRQMITFNGVVNLPDAAVVQRVQDKATKTIRSQMEMQAQNHPSGAIGTLLQAARVGIAHADFNNQTLALEQRAESESHVNHVSVRDAVEGADTMVLDSDRMPLGLHLRAVSLDPIVHEPYQSSNYLPPEQPIPRNYSLIDKESGSPDKYDNESTDTLYVRAKPIQLSEASCRLLHMPGDLFTIQLIGSEKPGIISSFVNANHIRRGAMRCAINDKHKHNWFMALYGTFPSFADAEAALVNLPKGMRYNGAFVRKISGVQGQVERKT